ncbi:hypothetical protein LTR78_010499 [Recurvomyces mirabilis]|uniref:MOSC domain-containing protein n=1 Tax=Recurvomyces mirabilis TaxID=574656 RepID=A0AAE0WG71_9PEZI|nr:hypothetical protein LTR78_010499 [Recurvomyces mirabilis]KAK5151682.1 hypothetical protein LTS14_009169 [Recurvomyces mirabilis]
MKIQKIYTYPIKGIRATELNETVVTKHGFPYDRRYMLLQVEEGGGYKNMAIGHYPAMARYFPSINIPEDGDALTGTITIAYKPPNAEGTTFDIPLVPKTDGLEEVEVTMHKSPTKAYKMAQKYNEQFSSCFGFDCILVYLGTDMRRVLMTTSGNKQASESGWLSSMTSKATQLVMGNNEQGEKITFADCAPYLVVSEKSMDDVHHRLQDGEPYDIVKFRPNIIISGADEPWEEDFWGELTFGGDTKIVCDHNCGRLSSTCSASRLFA